MGRQMLHQPEEKRQIPFFYKVLIKRQDELVIAGGNEIVGILNALGDAFVAMQLPDIIVGQKRAQIIIGNLRIDSQSNSPSVQSDLSRWGCVLLRKFFG